MPVDFHGLWKSETELLNRQDAAVGDAPVVGEAKLQLSYAL